MMSEDKSFEGRIEAALYSAGRPISVDELCRAAQTTSRRKVISSLLKIIKKVEANFAAIEVIKVGDDSYAMQLKPQFNSMAKKFANQPLLSKSIMKTLTMIAYFQPVSARSLSARRGSSVYRHLKILESMGFVSSTAQGKSSSYTTTEYFSDYFGLPKDKTKLKESLKRLFPEQVEQSLHQVST